MRKLTDRQTCTQTDYNNPPVHARGLTMAHIQSVYRAHTPDMICYTEANEDHTAFHNLKCGSLSRLAVHLFTPGGERSPV